MACGFESHHRHQKGENPVRILSFLAATPRLAIIHFAEAEAIYASAVSVSSGTGMNIMFISVSVSMPGIRSAKLYCQLSTA